MRMRLQRAITTNSKVKKGGLAALFDSIVLHQPAFLAIPVAFLLRLTLIVELLALGEGDFDFCAALIVEIDLQRHERHAFAVDADAQASDLTGIQQQLASA